MSVASVDIARVNNEHQRRRESTKLQTNCNCKKKKNYNQRTRTLHLIPMNFVNIIWCRENSRSFGFELIMMMLMMTAMLDHFQRKNVERNLYEIYFDYISLNVVVSRSRFCFPSFSVSTFSVYSCLLHFD